MLVAKSLHLIFVISWFAGLFYLPRILVNLALVPTASTAERDRLLLMSAKLFRFMLPLAVLAVASGLWLWLAYGFSGIWLHVKLLLVAFLLAYHWVCGRLLAKFVAGNNSHSHIWYRWFNEAPVLILAVVVFLVVLKPF